MGARIEQLVGPIAHTKEPREQLHAAYTRPSLRPHEGSRRQRDTRAPEWLPTLARGPLASSPDGLRLIAGRTPLHGPLRHLRPTDHVPATDGARLRRAVRGPPAACR